MKAVIEYDPNDPRTWPKEDVDGKYVIYKAKKNYGLYEYEVSRTKAFKKPLDCVLAWMQIPENLRKFGEKAPLADGNLRKNYLVLDGKLFMHNGKCWELVKDETPLGEIFGKVHDNAMTDENLLRAMILASNRKLTEYVIKDLMQKDKPMKKKDVVFMILFVVAYIIAFLAAVRFA